MLPGLRFVCAAIVLSMSLLVFGFGATALFRSARQDVASLPVLRAPPETVFAPPEPQPRLAMLQVEPAADSDAPLASSPVALPTDQVPLVLPALTETDRTATPEKPSALSPPPEVAAVAEAPQPQPVPDVSFQVLPEAAKSDAPAPTEVAKLEIVPAVTPAIVAPEPPAAAEPPVLLVTEPVTPVAAAPAPAVQPSPMEPSQISTTVATLGGPAVTIAPAVRAKPVVAAPKKTVRKRTVKRKRVAARAAPARATPTAEAANPFAPPFR